MQPPHQAGERLKRYQSANCKAQRQRQQGAQIHQEDAFGPEHDHERQAKLDPRYKGYGHPEYVDSDGKPERSYDEMLMLGPELKVDLLNQKASAVI